MDYRLTFNSVNMIHVQNEDEYQTHPHTY